MKTGWYKTPLGSELLRSELKVLSNVLPQTFGYYIAQIGGPVTFNDKNVLAETTTHNHIMINPEANLSLPKDTLKVKCRLDALPFLPESLDTVVLFHILEFVKEPKTILDEIYRSLIDGGYLIILGFNPFSLWGLKKLFTGSDSPSSRGQTAGSEKIWHGNWLTPSRMYKLLREVEFDSDGYQTCYFRPPTTKMLFMEGFGQIFWPYCGASYMFVARKTSAVLTPLPKTDNLSKKSKIIEEVPRVTS